MNDAVRSHTQMTTESCQKQLEKLRANLSQVIRGKDDVIDLVLLALISGESVLIEDVPGVGKTTLAKALAASIELEFKRVQCTPDLLPADIFGFSVFNPQDSSFTFRPGPIFCNILLVDEINRASPRTQSALLEAMAERQVTIEGKVRTLDPPFIVIATQNPSGSSGTFPLPESQLDRFLLQISMEYPDAESEVDILYDQAAGSTVGDVETVLSSDELIDLQSHVHTVRVDRTVADYMVAIAGRTRSDERLQLGCSPRGTLMLFRASQARALLSGRDYVLPDDVQEVGPYVLSHRVVLRRSQQQQRLASVELIRDIISQIEVPV